MNMKVRHTSITVKQETYDLLQSIKSCFQLKFKKNISYDEIIQTYTFKGVEEKEPKIAEIIRLMEEDDSDRSGEETQIADTAESGPSVTEESSEEEIPVEE